MKSLARISHNYYKPLVSIFLVPVMAKYLPGSRLRRVCLLQMFNKHAATFNVVVTFFL